MASHTTTTTRTATVASTTAVTGSRLAEMQVRFQQRQMQEREQKRQELTEAALFEANRKMNSPKPLSNGKVRQMFDERRRGAGIDRSNPLKPITTTASKPKVAARGSSVSNTTIQGISRRSMPTTQAPPVMSKRVSSNGNNNMTFHERYPGVDEMDNINDESLPADFNALSLSDFGDRNNNMGSSPKLQSATKSNIRLKPIQSRKAVTSSTIPPTTTSSNLSMPTSTPTRPTATYTAQRSGQSVTSTASQRSSASRTKTPGTVKTDSRQDSRSRQTAPAMSGPLPPGMVSCSYCGRNFLEERLAKHEEVCRKIKNTKRKVFDITKKRVGGTEAEKFLGKPQQLSSRHNASSSVLGKQQSPKKNNWRKKHEEFIAAIRAAKQVQLHLAKGGKLSDLPPPPPSENPDYIQCPHCQRRFNQAAAERHIPKCATMLHNKPKPGMSKRR